MTSTKKRNGLGKGLGNGIDVLIPAKVNTSSTGNGEVDLDINQIEPNKNQPRKNFNEDSLMELADSIKQHGIVQPLVVSKKDDYYIIIAGERRWRAAKIAGLKRIPVIIKDYSPQEIMEIALIENIQREDLNPVEEAHAFRRLIMEYDLKQDDVAERVSKSRTSITNALRLLKLDSRILDMLIDERITSGHARALLSIPGKDEQYHLAMKIFDEKLSVREIEKLVKQIVNPAKVKVKTELSNSFIFRDLEKRLREITGTKVTIKRKNEKQGKIEIEFYSTEDIERITEYFKEASE
jgi:ParB family chromosome partitioning protein